MVAVLFLLFSTEQESQKLLQEAKLILRFLIRALSIFFDLTIELLKGLMSLEEALLGQATSQHYTPVSLSTVTPTPGSQTPAPTQIVVEPTPSRAEIIKCCGGLWIIVILVSLVLGLQQIFRFVSKIFL